MLECLFEACPDPIGALAFDQRADLGTRHEDEVVLLGQTLGQGPEGLTQRTLDLVAVDGAADLAAGGDTEPHITGVLVLARKAVEHEIARGVG